jgi:hypothetical protein
MLVEQGRELSENGQVLADMGDEHEGRARVMAGAVVSEVGQCILLDARSAVMRRELASLGRRIRAAVKGAS